MSVRPRINRNRKRQPTLTASSYRLTAVAPSATGSRTPKNETRIIFPNGVTLKQKNTLPRLPGQVGFRGDRPVNQEDLDRAAEENNLPIAALPESGFIDVPDLSSPSKHRNKRLKQWERWTYEILPLITPHYLNFQHRTHSLRDETELCVEPHSCECCQTSRKLKIWVVRFSKIEQIELWASDCSKAAVQLIRSGLFPCSPVYPTLAVDIRVLDFVRRLFLRIAPNYTAWCSTAIDFLAAQGYHLPGDDPLRRRFANALQWFMSLHDKVTTQIDAVLQHVRQEIVPVSSTTPSHLSPRSHCADTMATPSYDGESTTGHQAPCLEEFREKGHLRKRSREDRDDLDLDDSNPTESDNMESELRSPLTRPTECLRARCVACFGGDCKNVVVNVDACYTQKHSSKGGRDPPRTHPRSFFIPETEVKAWKQYVDLVRPSKQQAGPPKKRHRTDNDEQDQDHFEEGLRVPKSVLDGCLASFTAADEARIKGSTRFFDVTANMTLLCRHDRPLFSVNIDTAGEGQHFVFALLSKLFENLPPHVEVRFLYDIGCQLHRSCEKWGFLKPYLTRLTFAVSIFHAFGHQWPCQLIYHPRKCAGYGLSDGEGAERLWHSLSHLIAYGRVAGYHVRMYNLDSQFHFNSDEALYKLGLWLHRKVLLCNEKLKEAEEILQACGIPEEVLRDEWEAQIKAQTKPLPRQHKHQAKSAVEEALQLRKARDAAQDHVDDLRKRIIDMSSESWDVATAELELQSAVDTLRRAQGRVTRKEDTLGVDAKHQLRSLIKSPFLTKKMNARALKMRIRERLRSRKFELDRLERSYRKQRSEQRINEHTQDSVKRRDPGISQLAHKYNKLCDDMNTLIRQKKAPRNVVAPIRIDMEKLFELDVDDDIWLDIGLGYEEEGDGRVPPRWLSDDNVRAGIRAMTDRDRCHEEHVRLYEERSAMQVWFNEEWRVVNAAIDQGTDADIQFQLKQRRDTLCRLLVVWERTLVGVPFAEALPEWGPTLDELAQYRAVHVLGGGVDLFEDSGYDYDVDFEVEADGLLVEHLDSLRLTENYRELERSTTV
ncbi:hypothetical protein F5880DRAFT_1478695 [Lentinula raphanica]|nr:hypothetical protein F5880DRAFT_1478695 [Lentinula raphanica]